MFDSLSLVARVSELGTLLTTFFTGELVGQDSYGNRYFRSRRKSLSGHKKGERHEKRWVLYSGEPEPTKIPPKWYGWVHKMCDQPLRYEGTKSYQGEKLHYPNLTGTNAAFLPRKHIFSMLALDKKQKSVECTNYWQPPK